MNTIFLQLLADRHGIPAGLVLATRQAPEPAEALLELASKIPCHYRTGQAGPCAGPLHDAGWRPLPPDRTLRADAPPGDAVPPHVTWIEGDWALAPPVRPAGNAAASHALALQLVERVNADADTHEIEELLRRDPTLSYHLLRLVNSLGMGAGRKVNTFAQGILLLGRQQLRRWLNLMLFAARRGDARAPMLLARVSVRARLMELLARATGMDRQHQELAFMTGMFSLLGVLFGAPLGEVLAPLAIADGVQRALLDRQGELGALLDLVLAAEGGDFEAVGAALEQLQVPAAEFNALVVEATLWMLTITVDVAGKSHG